MKNNSSYQGEWENDNYNGQGILTLEDGTSYQGYFNNGTLNNLEKSIIKYVNGDNYTGQVSNGVPEGHYQLPLVMMVNWPFLEPMANSAQRS